MLKQNPNDGKYYETIRGLKSEPVVGQEYLVPCWPNVWFFMGWMPILGDAHNDDRYNFGNEDHYHPDLRFVHENDWYKLLDDARKAEKLFGMKFCPHDIVFNLGYEAVLGSRTDYLLKRESDVVDLRPMTCLREQPEYKPGGPRAAVYILESHYDKALMNPKKQVCPHHGAELASFPTQTLACGRQCVTCPMHGLTFDRRSGAMVSRYELSGKPRMEISSVGPRRRANQMQLDI